MESDLQRQRKSKRSFDLASVGATSVQVVPYDEDRTSLIIGNPVAARVTLSFGNPAVVDSGINIYAGGPALRLSLLEHGAIVRGPIFGVAQAGTELIAWWAASNGGP